METVAARYDGHADWYDGWALPLEGLLTALLQPGLRLDRIVERGDRPIPDILAVRLARARADR
jgi:hypothetical protein